METGVTQDESEMGPVVVPQTPTIPMWLAAKSVRYPPGLPVDCYDVFAREWSAALAAAPTRAAYEAEIAELVSALEPFAEAGGLLNEPAVAHRAPDEMAIEDALWISQQPTVGDPRRAAELVQKHRGGR